MARPVADEPRKRNINVRFTDAEFRQIEQAIGARNRSDVVRRLLLDWARHENDGE